MSGDTSTKLIPSGRADHTREKKSIRKRVLVKKKIKKIKRSSPKNIQMA